MRNNDTALEAWSRLAHAKTAVCAPSTFCLWPTLAARNGVLLDSRQVREPLVPDAHVAAAVLGQNLAPGSAFVSFETLRLDQGMGCDPRRVDGILVSKRIASPRTVEGLPPAATCAR